MDIDESCALSPGISINHVHYRLEHVGTIVTWGYHMETIDDHKCEHGIWLCLGVWEADKCTWPMVRHDAHTSPYGMRSS